MNIKINAIHVHPTKNPPELLAFGNYQSGSSQRAFFMLLEHLTDRMNPRLRLTQALNIIGTGNLDPVDITNGSYS